MFGAVAPGGATSQNGWSYITDPRYLTSLPLPGGAQLASGPASTILGDFATILGKVTAVLRSI